jgi:hypothetical protein
VAVAACGEATPTQVDDLDPAFTKVGGSQGPLVTGSGHTFRLDPFKDGGESLRDFTVSVVETRNGVTGHMHLGSVASLRRGLSFIGEVTCVTVVDNGDGTKDAWVGGINKHTNYDGNDMGAQFAVRVRDGGDVGPDGVSGVRFAGLTGIPDIGELACAVTPGWFMSAVDAGNIKIR